MTTAQIKEQISKHLIGLLVSQNGFIIEERHQDFGVDLTITKIKQTKNNGHSTYRDTGIKVEFQLKCATEKTIVRTERHIKYDLSVINYNDLVERETRQWGIPLYLLLVILPNDPKNWFLKTKKSVTLNVEVYWYTPKESKVPLKRSKNKYKERINIDLTNEVGLDFFNILFEKLYKI